MKAISASYVGAGLQSPTSCFAESGFRTVTAVPLDISSTDKFSDVVPRSAGLLLPDTSIATLDGGINLGALLFAFVLYNGLFGKAGRPADWVLPGFARLLNQENEQWYRDYADGLQSIVPPQVEFLRFAVFTLLGWGTNLLWVSLFDGDEFWGWSTGLCLALPSALINLSREPKLTREEATFDVSRNTKLLVYCEGLL
jgi:hypothetical protein